MHRIWWASLFACAHHLRLGYYLETAPAFQLYFLERWQRSGRRGNWFHWPAPCFWWVFFTFWDIRVNDTRGNFQILKTTIAEQRWIVELLNFFCKGHYSTLPERAKREDKDLYMPNSPESVMSVYIWSSYYSVLSRWAMESTSFNVENKDYHVVWWQQWSNHIPITSTEGWEDRRTILAMRRTKRNRTRQAYAGLRTLITARTKI